MSRENTQKEIRVKSKNVYNKPLYLFSKKPLTGYNRDGFCDVPESDTGNHSVAGTVTDQFLDFSAAQGNDLRKQAGLKDGDRWCLCAHRWKEAFDAKEGPRDPKVPMVSLSSSHVKALDVVDFKDLKMFAAPTEIQDTVWPNDRSSSPVRQSKEIGGKEPKA